MLTFTTDISIQSYIIIVTVHGWAQPGQTAVCYNQQGHGQDSALLLFQHFQENSTDKLQHYLCVGILMKFLETSVSLYK
jgi:hypothetical protein